MENALQRCVISNCLKAYSQNSQSQNKIHTNLSIVDLANTMFSDCTSKLFNSAKSSITSDCFVREYQ